MNETLLIILGVAVFAMTIVAVLIYFYSLVNELASDDISTDGIVEFRVADTDD